MKAAPDLIPPGHARAAANPAMSPPCTSRIPDRLFQRQFQGLCRQVALLILVVLTAVAGLGATTSSLHAQSPNPVSNPDLTATCGLDIVLVIDESSSLVPYRETVQESIRGLLEALANTGSAVALVEFNEDARLPLPGGATYHPVTIGPNGTLSPGGLFDTYLTHSYIPNGYTNWEAAFATVNRVNQTSGVAPLVIFVTDDEPNVYSDDAGVPVVGGEQQVLDEAIHAANAVKAAGSHIFVVGVGGIESNDPLIAVSGPDRYPDLEGVLGRADYTRTDFDQLRSALREIVFGVCGPSVTITKHVVQNGVDQLLADQSFIGTVRITEAGVPPESFVWLEPIETGTTSRRVTTGADGTAQWQWTPSLQQIPQAWPSAFTLTEVNRPEYAFERATCTRKTLTNNGGATSSTFTLSTLPATFTVGPDDLITCDVYNARVALAMQKQATPSTVPENGAPVTFDFALFNNGSSAITIESLIDDRFGNLHGQGTCIGDGSLALVAGAVYRCAITTTIAGNRGTPHVNTVTATVRAPDNTTRTATASATVTFRDAQPQAQLSRTLQPTVFDEPGGSVTHSLTITNSSIGESLFITELVDLPFGDVTTIGGPITATTCAVPQTLAPAGQANSVYRCDFQVNVTGNPGPVPDTVTVHLRDDDGNSLQLTDIQSVQIRNLLPSVTFQVELDPASMDEPGGHIQQRATITNRMRAESLFLTALESSLGTLGSGVQTTCTFPQPLAPGAAYQCDITAQVAQNAGDYSVVMTATVTDDDGSVIRPVQSNELLINDVPSAIEVTMNADRTTLAEPGDDVTFTVAVKNTSPVDTVSIQRINDDTFGDLAGYCDAALPATLLPNALLRCDFVGAVSGAVGSIQRNEVTADGVDDDGKAVTDSDQESIEITDVPAQLAIVQTAQPANIPEPGGVVTVTTLIRNISLTDHVLIQRVETNEVEQPTLLLAQGDRAQAQHGQGEATGLIDISATCTPALPVALPPNGTIECRFTKVVSGPIHQRHTSTVVVSGVDDELIPLQQNSREAIDIIDVPSSIRLTESSTPVSVPEAGALVTFTVQIHNTSRVDTVTLNTLSNDRFGDLSDSCPVALPTDLAAGEILRCTFTRLVTGDVDTLLRQQSTVTAIDDDGQPLGDNSQSTIGVTDTPSSLKVTQLANPTGITEPGGLVTFTAIIENNSAVDGVTIQRVQENTMDDLSAACVPQVPTTLAPGERIRCRFTRLITGRANTTEESTITVQGVDDDGVTVTDYDLIQVDILDAMPVSMLEATATPNEFLETGDTVAISLTVVNQGPEVTVLTVLSNTLVGDLNGVGDCLLPQALAADGGSYSCSYATFVAGDAGSPPDNIIYALVADDEGNERMVQDEADLFLIAVRPDLQHTKTDELTIDVFEDPADEGRVSPGDTLRYTINMRNEGNGAAYSVILEDRPDPNTRLVVGSVTTNRGSVLQGNRAGDEIVTVLLGDLDIGETATVQFDVFVIPGTGTTLLRNQASLSHTLLTNPGGTSISGSDDPTTPFLGDPTDTAVFIPPTNLEPTPEPENRTHTLFLPMVQRQSQ